MAHEVESMFYVGEKPWHGLGVELPDVATAEEALVAAGLNWDVEKVPVYAKVNDVYIPIDDRSAIIRTDTNDPLGIVGNVYKPFPNSEAFSFFDNVVQSKEAKYETAGSLKGGKKIWILARVGGTIRIADSNDLVNEYVLLYNSHDGTSTIEMMITPIRVVCMNTLNVAITRKGRGIKIRHTGRAQERIDEARNALMIVRGFYDEFSETADFLAGVSLKSREELDTYLDLAGFELDDEDDNKSGLHQAREKVIELFDFGRGMDENRHSVWNAFNAVVEFVDHDRRTRQTRSFQSPKEARLYSQWFGPGSNIKQKAWKAALQFAKAA